MKKLILSAAIASAIAAAAVAAPQDKPKDPQDPQAVQSSSQSSQAQAPKTMRGSITSVDNTAKSFVIKDEASGKEVTVYWTGSTKLNGELKVGSMVSIETADQGGRTVATSIDASGAKKPY